MARHGSLEMLDAYHNFIHFIVCFPLVMRSLTAPCWVVPTWCTVPSSYSAAGVAELADAPDSKSGSRKRVGVQVPPPAPTSEMCGNAGAYPDASSRRKARPPLPKQRPRALVGAFEAIRQDVWKRTAAWHTDPKSVANAAQEKFRRMVDRIE